SLRAILGDVTALLDVVPEPAALEDLAAVIAELTDPGPFLAYTHGDPCPDNDLLVDGALKLVDFEFGAYRHALIDGVYGRICFPTCWCVNRLPSSVAQEMEAAYRTALSQSCPAAADDRAFAHGIVAACVYWALRTCQFAPLTILLDRDADWGIATMRQRVLV